MAWTNGWAPGEKVWLIQGAQVQVRHLSDWKEWPLGLPLLTLIEVLAAKGAVPLWIETAFLSNHHQFQKGWANFWFLSSFLCSACVPEGADCYCCLLLCSMKLGLYLFWLLERITLLYIVLCLWGGGDVFMKLILPNIMNSGILTKTWNRVNFIYLNCVI